MKLKLFLFPEISFFFSLCPHFDFVMERGRSLKDKKANSIFHCHYLTRLVSLDEQPIHVNAPIRMGTGGKNRIHFQRLAVTKEVNTFVLQQFSAWQLKNDQMSLQFTFKNAHFLIFRHPQVCPLFNTLRELLQILKFHSQIATLFLTSFHSE